MATTNSNVGFDIFANKIIETARVILSPIFAFSLDLSAEAKKIGDVIRVPMIGAGSAADFNASSNNYKAAAVATLQDREVAIDTRKLSKFGIDDAQAAAYSPSWWEAKAQANANAVCAALLDDVAALITAANYGDTATDKVAVSLAGFGTKGVAAIRSAAIGKSIRPRFASLVLNSEYFSALLGALDSNVYGGPEAIRSGMIPGLMGFGRVVEFPTLTIPGFVCAQDAVCIANRWLKPIDPAVYSYAAPATDEESGLTIGVREYTDPDTGMKSVSAELCYGKEIGSTQLVRII